MIELIRTDDVVFLTLLQVRLDEAGIKYVVLDRHTASAYGGALLAVNARVMVDEADLAAARAVVNEIGAAEEPPLGA